MSSSELEPYRNSPRCWYLRQKKALSSPIKKTPMNTGKLCSPGSLDRTGSIPRIPSFVSRSDRRAGRTGSSQDRKPGTMSLGGTGSPDRKSGRTPGHQEEVFGLKVGHHIS